ncbi:putative sugar-bisphosphate aldolase [Escherichia coli]|uniref:Putative sugar-bisphosphate aldolase n=1 Tax=Escherichia coli TaxID=562 RepID=A0A376Y787_ECOLX|nr:putative sugar-bisphosphate aldolase [Escherichia coli]
MLADIRYWENDATNKHYAIAHFNVWNAEILMGVIDAAEEAKSPVIFLLVQVLSATPHLKISLT